MTAMAGRQFRRGRGRKGRRLAGLSLIEVLMAMAIFVIGILAVLRIFPKGLGLIGTNRDKASAQRLADSTLAQLRAAESQLPDEIVQAGLPTVTDPAAAGFGFVQVANGLDLTRPYDFEAIAGWSDGTDPSLYRAVGANRLVLGERIVVPRGPSVSALVAPTYTLFGPVDKYPAGSASPGNYAIEIFREYRSVTPAQLKINTVNGALAAEPVFCLQPGGNDPFSGAPLNDNLLFELDASARVVIVRYAYYDVNGKVVQSQLAAGLSTLAATGANPSGTFVSVPLPSPYVIPGSVHVRQPLAHGGGGSYSFDDSSANLGLVRINPALAGETLSMEYVVQDWRLLHQTVQLTLSAAGQIQNSANGPVTNGILQINDTGLDATDIDPGTGQPYAPMLVLLSTGQPIAVDPAQWNQNLANAGQIPLIMNTGLTVDAGAYEVMVWYHKQGNWAVAPAIAPSEYLLDLDATTLQAQVTGGVVPPNTVVETEVTSVGGKSYCDLYFRPSEAGRAVMVTYESGPPAGGRVPVDGEVYVVPPQSNGVSTLVAGAPRHIIHLKTPLDPTGGLVAGNSTVSDVRPWIHAVEGLSLQLRVLYNDENYVRPNVPTAPNQAAGNSRQRMFELGWFVRRHR
jgi:hypothetical protein